MHDARPLACGMWMRAQAAILRSDTDIACLLQALCQPVEGYYPPDADICSLLDKGTAQAVADLQRPMHQGGSTVSVWRQLRPASRDLSLELPLLPAARAPAQQPDEADQSVDPPADPGTASHASTSPLLA